jgi:L-amino acid N-acyltransferase YncA
MSLSPIFKLREQVTKEIISLLDSVVLGTNGAHYKHLDTEDKINQADAPLFLSLERNEHVLGNVTFCRRGKFWYIRYFAFSELFQSNGKSKSKGRGLLKRELTQFFDNVFKGEGGETPHSFYAYIDTQNEKSLWMSEHFGFEKRAEITTQTFSRINPKLKASIQKVEKWDDVKCFVRTHFESHDYYFESQVNKPPYYIWKSDSNEVLGFAKISTARWEIKRFPGKLGGVLIKMMPFIPRINSIIKPKNHVFLAPEAVYVKEPKQMGMFLESILNRENQKLMIWWVDTTNASYTASRDCTNWGVLNRLIGRVSANLVVKRNPQSVQNRDLTKSVYTSGFDFI